MNLLGSSLSGTEGLGDFRPQAGTEYLGPVAALRGAKHRIAAELSDDVCAVYIQQLRNLTLVQAQRNRQMPRVCGSLQQLPQQVRWDAVSIADCGMPMFIPVGEYLDLK